MQYATAEGIPYIGADELAASLDSVTPESVRMEAGRQFIRSIDQSISSGQSCVVESTLSGLTIRNSINKAVELGFERISEVQNEILWICEAAHIPVIWATQVLENMAKTGIPTRAEISDAAKAAQAECVMLNKGPYINNAIQVLKNILIRMSGHSFKKKNELRALNVAKSYAKTLKEPKVLVHD